MNLVQTALLLILLTSPVCFLPQGDSQKVMICT